jgi:hypothetical protein
MSVAAVPYPSLSPELGWSGTPYVQIMAHYVDNNPTPTITFNLLIKKCFSLLANLLSGCQALRALLYATIGHPFSVTVQGL